MVSIVNMTKLVHCVFSPRSHNLLWVSINLEFRSYSTNRGSVWLLGKHRGRRGRGISENGPI